MAVGGEPKGFRDIAARGAELRSVGIRMLGIDALAQCTNQQISRAAHQQTDILHPEFGPDPVILANPFGEIQSKFKINRANVCECI